MPGTAAGARKGWKVRKNGHSQIAPAMSLKQAAEMNRIISLKGEAGGTNYFSGLKINLQKLEEEYVPSLARLDQRVDLFDRMANDPAIKKQLRVNILPLISNVRWKVEGGSTEAQDLLAANLLREGDRRLWCDTSWNHRLFEHLQCLKYGFAAHGKTWRVVDGYRIFGRLTYLHPRSFKGTLGPWEFNEQGELIAVHRTYKTGGPAIRTIVDERLAIADVFLTVWEPLGENWEGTAMIRSMYRAFTEKDLASKIQMINLQNVGVGIPDAEMAPGDGIKDRDSLVSIVESLRGGSKERQYIVRKSGQKVGFLTGQTLTDAGPIIDGKNLDIFGAGATEFMSGGQSQMGSRANASVQMTMSLVQIDAVRACMEDQVNWGAGYLPGLAEELQDENFSGLRKSASDPIDSDYARITGSRVSPTEQLDNVPLVGELVRGGAVPRNLQTCNELLKKLGYGELTQTQFDAGVGARSPVDIGTPSGQPEAGAPAPAADGRPPNAPNAAQEPDPRKDVPARRYGLQDSSAQKKTLDASRPQMKSASYPWLK